MKTCAAQGDVYRLFPQEAILVYLLQEGWGPYRTVISIAAATGFSQTCIRDNLWAMSAFVVKDGRPARWSLTDLGRVAARRVAPA